MKLSDLVGQRYGLLVAVERAPSRARETHYLCRCDCGTVKIIARKSLVYGRTTSCGCARSRIMAAKATTHGLADSPEYRAWQRMKQRCLNPHGKDYAIYGGRGIQVFPGWIESFARFIADVGQKPSPQHSLDRIDPNGDYAPGNVRWATPRQQANNRRNNHTIAFGDRSQTLAQWSEELGIDYDMLERRINLLGWSVERALTSPSRFAERP